MILERQTTTRDKYKEVGEENTEYERASERERERERETQFLSLQPLQNRGNQKKEQRTEEEDPKNSEEKLGKKKLLVKERKKTRKFRDSISLYT